VWGRPAPSLRLQVTRLYHNDVTEYASEDREYTLVLGVGNAMKGDDGVGPYVAARLTERKERDADPPCDAGSRVTALDCAMTPENHTSVVRRLRPGLLVIVDAAEMGLSAGECRIIAAHRVGSLGLSTHSMPLSLFMDYVSDMVGRTVLIGVQPRTMALGEGISPEVRDAGDELVALLTQGRLDHLRVLD
jgi:hydrogenase 3 maturation protease